MRKHFIAVLCMMVLGITNVFAQSPDPVSFEVGFREDLPLLPGGQKNPITPPSAGLDDHTLYIYGEHPAYTLYLVDTSGDEPDVVYQITVPANVNVVYYFYGYITL